MLNKLKKLFTRDELLQGNFGIEREALRVNTNGELSRKMHPSAFGDKLKNKYITTDFSESQIEVITPTFDTVEEVYNFSNVLYDIAVSEMGNEHLWPQSMPCIIDDEKNIKVAQYNNDDIEFQKYREKLLGKYG